MIFRVEVQTPHDSSLAKNDVSVALTQHGFCNPYGTACGRGEGMFKFFQRDEVRLEKMTLRLNDMFPGYDTRCIIGKLFR